MVFTEQMSNHNQEEVKADLAFLIEKQCFETKSELSNFKEEVSEQFMDTALTKTIQTLFQTPSGERNELAFNPKTTPALDFIAQLCMVRCGIRTTKIDSDFGASSQAGVKQLKQLYNKLCRPVPQPHIIIDGNPNSDFFQAVTELMCLIPRGSVAAVQNKDISPTIPQSSMLMDTVQTNELDEGKTITISDPAAQQGRIEQFIPERNYKILLNYSQTNSRYKQHSNVIAQRDHNQKTYIVVSGAENLVGKRALIYPGIQLKKINSPNNVDKLTPRKIQPIKSVESVPELPKIALKINEEFNHSAQNKRKVQFSREDVIDACKTYQVPVNYFLAVSRNDSNHGTNGKARRTKNPGNYGNMDNGKTKTFTTRRDGVFKLAEHLEERITAYKQKYGEQLPPLVHLMTGKGPDGMKFFRGVRMTAPRGPAIVNSISKTLDKKGISKTYIPDLAV